MVTKDIRQELTDAYSEELLFADGFDEAIVGVSSGIGESRVVYDIAKMLNILTTKHNMSVEEADEYLSFNTIFAWVGQRTPIYIDTV
jgi:hypothetical protein